LVAKSFPRKQHPAKNFHKKFFGLKFFMVPKSFPPKHVPTKNFHQKYFDRKILMVSKSFPRKQVPTKTFNKNFQSKICNSVRIISSKTGAYNKLREIL